MPNTVPEPGSNQPIQVAVAVIERVNQQGQREILIAKRAKDVHQGGLWEFPGGKVEPNESVPEALARELFEELGLTVPCSEPSERTLCPLIQIEHDYGDKRVFLDVWEVKSFTGEAHGREGQSVRWVAPKELSAYRFPAANQAIVKACRLPRHYAITPQYPDLTAALQGVGALLEQNLNMVVLRQPQLNPLDYRQWAEQILAYYQSSLATILLSGDPNELQALPAGGVHAPFRYVQELRQRPVSDTQWFGVSCHNEAELRQAERLRADFVTLAPVLPTLTHPGAVALGWRRFAELVRHTQVPVFALGGLQAPDYWQAISAGAQGLAGIRLWQGVQRSA